MWCKNVIVIGLDHINTLGVVRVLGKNGIMPSVIITGDASHSFVKSSKFIKKIWFIRESEKHLLHILNKVKPDSDGKIPVIPTSDFAALVLDENYHTLSTKYLLPSINGEEGMIKRYMDKMKQIELAKQYHIKTVKTWEIDLHKKEDTGCSIFPCIIKPKISAYGKKSDITICNNKQEYEHALMNFKRKHYDEVIAQEYIKMDFEVGIHGCIYGGEMICPGVMEKRRIYPKGRGNMSFAKLQKKEKYEFVLQKILALLRNINYSGMFDIEMFVAGNQYYLNEINFRNSANSFFYAKSGVYIVYDWLCMVLERNDKILNKTIKRSCYAQNEILELKQLKEKEISFLIWARDFIISKGYVMLCFYDIKPIMVKTVNYIEKRCLKKYGKHKN